MKLFWKLWKDGWVVFFRLIWFYIVTLFALIPYWLCRLFIPAESQQEIFDKNGFHWEPAVLLALILIWGPVALSIASMGTGYFSQPEKVQDSVLNCPPADSYEI